MIRSTLFAAAAVLAIAGTAAAKPVCATWYDQGHHTANGDRFNPDGLTAAHRTLPFGTILRVEWRHRVVLVRVTDRGPAKWTGCTLDLSRGAARALDMIRAGRVTVDMEVLK